MAAVEKPGAKMNCWIWFSDSFSASASVARPLAIALALIFSVLRPRPSSAISMMMWPPSWKADSRMVPVSGLPVARRSLRAFEPVVGGVAHHVGERILDQVEHLAVELGLRADHLQLDLLAKFVGEVAHDARQLLPGIADRLHARLHHAFLQLGGDVGQPLQRHLELGILVAADDLQELVAGQHQLRHHGHQVFEHLDIDADALVLDHRLRRLVVVRRPWPSAFLAWRPSWPRPSWPRPSWACARRRLRRAGALDLGLAERPLQLVERHLAHPQRTLQRLLDQKCRRCASSAVS